MCLQFSGNMWFTQFKKQEADQPIAAAGCCWCRKTRNRSATLWACYLYAEPAAWSLNRCSHNAPFTSPPLLFGAIGSNFSKEVQISSSSDNRQIGWVSAVLWLQTSISLRRKPAWRFWSPGPGGKQSLALLEVLWGAALAGLPCEGALGLLGAAANTRCS